MPQNEVFIVITEDGKHFEFPTFSAAHKWLVETRTTKFQLVMADGHTIDFDLIEPFME